MRRLLGPFLLLTVLAASAGCGGERGGADDPAPATAPATAPASAPGSPASADEVAFTEVALVSQTAAGAGAAGQPGRTGLATVLDSPAAVGPFADRFQQGPLTTQLLSAVDGASVPAGQVLLGAVVAVGCDVPPGIAAVTRTDQGLVLIPQKVADPLPECFAAVTTVALVLVDASAL